MEKRNYLLLVNTSTPQPEHARLKPALLDIDADAAFVYFDRHSVCALMQTHLEAHQIEDRLIGVLLNDDRRLVVELGRDWQTFGLDKAEMWLRRHPSQK